MFLNNANISSLGYLIVVPWGGGGPLGIFWVGMCLPGLQIGTPF